MALNAVTSSSIQSSVASATAAQQAAPLALVSTASADASAAASAAKADAASTKPAATSSQDSTTKVSDAAKDKLTNEQQAELRQLQAIDRKVRQHEQAHLAAGGGVITSGPTYSYQKGPDGNQYAVGGEVGIDTSPGRTPQDTISRAQRVIAAALAPADPSGQDRAVAAQAQQMEAAARAELSSQGASSAQAGLQDRQRDQVNQAYGAASSFGDTAGALNTYA